jgi:hypothetical protein
MNQLINRMIRAAKLEVDLYEEVEADVSATPQAAAVVVISSLATGLGAYSIVGLGGVVVVAVTALLGWLASATVIYVIGAKLLPEPQTEADIGQLLRTLGFASAPGIMRIFGSIPILGAIAVVAAFFWTLVATVIAVRQALDYESTGRAVAVCILGFIVQVFILSVLLRPFVADGV